MRRALLLLLLPALAGVAVHVQSAPDEASWTVVDPAGDAESAPGVPAAPGPWSDIVDIRHLRLREEHPWNVTLGAELGEFDRVDFSEPGHVVVGRLELMLTFHVSGAPIEYRARAQTDVYQGPSTNLALRPAAQGFLCLSPAPGECYTTRFRFGIDEDRNEVIFELRKESLTDRATNARFWPNNVLFPEPVQLLNAPPEGTPTELVAGDALEDVRLAVRRIDDQPPPAQDAAPDGGDSPPLVLGSDMANRRLRLDYDQENLNTIGFDRPRLFLFHLRNLDPVEKTVRTEVRIEYEFTSPGAAVPYDARFPSLLVVPANGSTTLPVLLSADSAELFQYGHFQISARTEGRPDEVAHHAFSADRGTQPSLDTPRLYLHVPKDPATTTEKVLCPVPPIALCPGLTSFNALETSPNAQPGGIAYGNLVNGFFHFTFHGRASSPEPWLFGPNAPVNVTLQMSSPVPLSTVPIRVSLSSFFGGQRIASGETTADLGPTPTPVSFPLNVLVPPKIWGWGEVPDIFEVAVGPIPPLPFALFTGNKPGPVIHGDVSFFDVPLRTPPVWVDERVPRGDVWMRGQAYGLGIEPEGLAVHAEGSRPLNLTLHNVGPQRELAWDVTAPPGWKVRSDPGKKFELGPDEALTLRLDIERERKTPEGATGLVVIQVRSEGILLGRSEVRVQANSAFGAPI